MLNRIPKSWILLAVFIVSVIGAGAWVFTTPPNGLTNQTGSFFGNTSNDANNYTADRIYVMNYVGSVVGTYLDSYSCDGSYCIYHPWYSSGQIYAKNMTTGKIDYAGTSLLTVSTSVFNALTPHRTNKQTVKYIGSFSGQILLQSQNYTRLDLSEANITTIGENPAVNIQYANNIEIYKGNLSGASQTRGLAYDDVLLLWNVTDSTVEGTEVTNGGYYGIALTDSSNNTIANINTHHNYRHGIHPGANTPSLGNGNKFSHIRANYNGGSGISERGSNVIGYGVNNTYTDIEAIGNGYNYASQSGVAFINEGGVALSNYILSDINVGYTTGVGITILNSSVSSVNLRSYNNSDHGISLQDVQDSTFSNTISKYNQKSANRCGIIVSSPSALTSKNITFVGGTSSQNTRDLCAYQSSAGSIDSTTFAFMNIYGATDIEYLSAGNVNRTHIIQVNGLSPYYWGVQTSCTTLTPFGFGDTCDNSTSKVRNYYNGATWIYANNTLVNSY